MFGLDVLGVGIGLIVIYLLLSLMCTATNELVAGLLNSRAKTLRKGVEQLFADTGFASFNKEFFEHSLIKSLAEGPAGPSYIPSKTFSKTMLDLIAKGEPADSLTWERVRDGAKDLGSDAALVQTLRILVGRTQGDLQKLETEIEAWFDSAMQRVSAWYKKKTHRVVLAIAVVIAGTANADTLTIVNSLSQDSALREALVAQAEAYVQQGRPAADLERNVEELKALGVLLGWTSESVPSGFGAWLQKVFGLLLTAFALSLGAPFWFDMLKKAVNIRSVGRAPEEIEAKES